MNGWRPWQSLLAVLLIGMVLAFSIIWVMSQPRGNSVILEPLPTAAPLTVHVAGQVKSPGIYIFDPGSRISDAVEKAGGMTSVADQDEVNLASVLRDGQQVYIPALDEQLPGKTGESTSRLTVERIGLLDLNVATLEELMELPGIGQSRAEDILAYREKMGRFEKVEDLLEVPGIGQGILDELKPLVTVLP